MAIPRFGYDRETEGQEETFGPSKTQVKNEMHGLQDLGLSLLDLPADWLADIEMDDSLREAFAELARIKSHEARRRQAQYIGKQLRNIDTTPFEAAIAAFQAGKADASRGSPDIARWRDRLLEDDGALTAWCAAYPGGDVRRLRTLIRSARQEAADALAAQRPNDPPPAKGPQYRALFQWLRTEAKG